MRMSNSSRRRPLAGLCSAALLAAAAPAAPAASVFLNELHYDNAGGDTGEAVEIAGPAGQSLAGWELLLYNGGNGAVYETVALPEAPLPDLQAGFGVVSVGVAGIQNGPADALALVDPGGAVIQFLSYEGVVTAAEGPAQGLESVDLGVSQGTTNPAGSSLGLVGSGVLAGDFAWAAGLDASFGAINPGQAFTSPVPVPPAGLLLLSAVPALVAARRRRAG